MTAGRSSWEPTEISKGLACKHVELYDFADRPLEVRWKEHALPYRVFNKDQCVSHAAIVENKRLGHALSIVKAQQDIKRETKVMTNSEKTGYKNRPRQVYGPDFVEKQSAPAALEMWKSPKTAMTHISTPRRRQRS